MLAGTSALEFGIAPDAVTREAQDHSANLGAKPAQSPDATIDQGSATAVESGESKMSQESNRANS